MSDRMTTYDFATKTFGHATMLVGGYDGKDIFGAMAELAAARKKLEGEYEKIRAGKPYDYYFVHGHHEWSKEKKE